MPKLLDADAVHRIILSHGGDAAMLREIERLPDGRPHGEWTLTRKTDEWFGYVFKCGNCGCEMIGDTRFCPSCGAKMDEWRERRGR